MTRRTFMACLAFFLLASIAPAADPAFHFPEGKYAKGELRYIHDIPVLLVSGTSDEMGEQIGKLAVRPMNLPKMLNSVLDDAGLQKFKLVLFAVSRGMFQNFPADYAKELDAVVKAAGADRTTMIFAQTLADLSAGFGCSTLIVEPGRSKTGTPLFGRNFDWPPAPGLTDHILVMVFRPQGKHAFATVTICPVLGCISGMNDAGLAVTVNEIQFAKDAEGKQFNPKGTPLLLMTRRILEECSTVAEAEKLVRSLDRTTTTLLTVCDAKGGAVFEVSTKNVEVRRAENSVCCATNHFRSEKLCVDKVCSRYDRLAKCQLGDEKLGVAEIQQRLSTVAQGKFTIESMIFEPTERRLHLAFGHGPATALPMKTLELRELFRQGVGP